ncbi:alcohol dehydrogenase catalytic domain-containing protein [Escherichia coli]|uniref:alcohol dehydrogenase catalytic domain-containing protein n=1 Tax=Escherichia coli TaxID=562 RepID=UPI003EE246BA
MKNSKAMLQVPGTMKIISAEIPVPKEDEVLIKVEYVGICGSDVHGFESGPFIPPKDPNQEIGLGHECAGTVVAVGSIMIVGTVPGDSAINFLKINREVTIQTVFRYANRYPVTIEAISSGRFDVKSMVTHIYDYRDVQQAFEESVNNKRDIIKGVIKISD